MTIATKLTDAIIEAVAELEAERYRQHRRADLAIEACDQARAAMGRVADELEAREAEAKQLARERDNLRRSFDAIGDDPTAWSGMCDDLDAARAEAKALLAERDSLRSQLDSITAALADEQTSHQTTLLRVAELDVPEPRGVMAKASHEFVATPDAGVYLLRPTEPPRPANAASDGEPRVTLPPTVAEGIALIESLGYERVAPSPCSTCHCPGDLEPADEHERRHGLGDVK